LAVGRKKGRKKERKRRKERKTDRQTDRRKERKKLKQNGLKRHVVKNILMYCTELIVIRYRITHHSYYIFHIA